MSNIIEGITKDLKAIPKNLKAKAGGMDTKKLVLLNVPYILAGYFCDKVAWLWRVSEGADASAKMIAAMNGFDTLFSNPLPSFHPRDLLIGAGCGIALRLVVYYKAKNAKKFRHGKEYGSARWGNAKDIEPYMDSMFENDVLLTQTERLMMSGRPKEPKYARNKNILVIGGSGSGKTHFFVKPNLMQMHSSYVVTDPKGTVLVQEALGKCPKCGGDVVKGKYGAYCKNKCGMNVGRAMGTVLSDMQIKSMLDGKKTFVKGLKGKKGTYDAYLIPEGIEDYPYTKDGKEIKGSQYKVKLEFYKK